MCVLPDDFLETRSCNKGCVPHPLYCVLSYVVELKIHAVRKKLTGRSNPTLDRVEAKKDEQLFWEALRDACMKPEIGALGKYFLAITDFCGCISFSLVFPQCDGQVQPLDVVYSQLSFDFDVGLWPITMIVFLKNLFLIYFFKQILKDSNWMLEDGGEGILGKCLLQKLHAVRSPMWHIRMISHC